MSELLLEILIPLVAACGVALVVLVRRCDSDCRFDLRTRPVEKMKRMANKVKGKVTLEHETHETQTE